MSNSIFIVFALTFGQIYGHPAALATESQNVAAPLFVKDSDGITFEPYDPLDYMKWIPDSSLNESLPMVQKHVTVDGNLLTYQDFNISALHLEQFKKHFMSTANFVDANGKLLVSDEEAQAYQASLIAASDDGEASIHVPAHLVKRDFPDGCFYDSRLHCTSACIDYISRGVRLSFNTNVYGYYHYVSEPQCGTGSITKTMSITHTSSVTIGGAGQIPSIQNLDVNTKRACSNPTVTPYRLTSCTSNRMQAAP
ncbi:hypothetical protein CI238_11922, partial [Colletotrichum incanum]